MKLFLAGGSGNYTMGDGTVFTPGADGTIDVPAQYANTLLHMGFVAVPDADPDPTAGRPNTGIKVGMMFWDLTLSRPIWFNGSGWQDAAGNAV